jgi:putative ABC transport system permease protein
MRELLQDLRYGIRRLLAAPLVTGAVVLSLALAIGANSAIFGAIDTLLLRPFPFPAPERLVRLYGTNAERGWQNMSLSYPNFADYRDQSRTLDDVAAYYVRGYTLTGIDRPERVAVVEVTSNLFSVLGLSPELGRGFVAGEDTPGASDRVVVLTHATWQSRFGGDPGVVGRTLRLNGVEHTVVGVLPRKVTFPANDVALWTPLRHDETTWNRFSGGLSVIARLAPGVSVEEASSEIATIAARLAEQYPRANAEVGGRLVGLAEDRYGPELRLTMYALMAAVGLMLLIACINVANLLLARASTRRREIAVRAALGAGRGRVSRMLLTESVILGLIGGGLGLLAAVGGMALLRGAAPANVPRIEQIQLDPVVVVFTGLVAVMTGLLFGLAPALQAARTDLSTALREGGRSRTASVGGRRAQRALVVAQVALVLLVLTGAGLMTRSLGALLAVNPGFQPEGRVALTVSLTPEYDSWEKAGAYREAALERLRALPGVTSAGAVLDLPLHSSNNLWDFLIEGRPTEAGRRTITGANVASPGYFQTMGIPLLEGRTFQESDRPGAPVVAVVSAAMARQFWPGEDALGKRIALPGSSGPNGPNWRTIVGVVGDVRHSGLREEGRAEMYLPFAQLSWPRRMTFVVRTSGSPEMTLAAARRALWSVDDDQAVFGTTTMAAVVSQALGTSRSVAWLLGIFGAVALLLASVGVFGLVANSIAQRRRELGIRAALGAASDRLFVMVIAQGMRPVALGAVLGIVAALFLSRLVKGLLFEIEPLDLLTFVSAPAVLLAVALLAIWWPARRAAHLNPMETLRAE